ncbi:hypothetical protein OROHE_014437 [Orobanche hederae]
MGLPLFHLVINQGIILSGQILLKEPEFLAGRQARIIYKGKQIRTFGIVNAEVLNNFDITDPCSFVELNIESFL